MRAFAHDVYREQLALGLPWSPELVERSVRATGATIQAAEAALEDGVAMNLGRRALSKQGLLDRDAYVRDTLRAAGVPVCVTLAGGYAEDICDTVEINLGTVETFSG